MTSLITLARIIEAIDNSSWRGACPPDLMATIGKAVAFVDHIAAML